MNTIAKTALAARACCARAIAVLALLCLTLAGTTAAAQGRPRILWSEAGHSDAVTAVVLSHDGKLLATSSNDRTLKLWRYPEGTLVRTLVLPYDLRTQVTGIESVRFTPDGTLAVAAVGRYDGVMNHPFGDVAVFRVSDGALVRVLAEQNAGVAAIDLSPDGSALATAGPSGVMVWRLADGTLIKSLAKRPGGASDVRYSPAGDRLCAGYDDHHLVSWKTRRWSLAWDVPAHDDTITRTLFSPDGARIATTSIDGTAKLFNATDGTVLHTLDVGSGAGLYAAAFTPDGAELATGGFDRTIRLWDAAQGTMIRQFADSGAWLTSLQFVEHGGVLLSGSEIPSRLEAWNPADGTRTRSLTRLSSQVNKVVFSSDSAQVAIATAFEQTVEVFDSASGRRLYAWNTGTEAEDVAFSPDGRFVAMPGPDNTIVVRRLSDGKKVRTLSGHQENVVGLSFSHDGTLLASGSFFPGSIRLWKTSDWSLAREIESGTDLGAFGPFMSLTFSPDDALLGTAAESSPLVVRVSDGTPVAHPSSVSRAVAFSPDGARLVTSGGVDMDEVRIFRTSDWTLAATLPRGANDIAFTPDGSRLVAAQLGALRIWNTSDWSVVDTYDQELGYQGSGLGVQAVAVSPDGRRFVYGRDDATVVMAKTPR